MGIYLRKVRGCRLSEKVLLTRPTLSLQTTTQLVVRWQTESTSFADAKRVLRYEVQWRHIKGEGGGSLLGSNPNFDKETASNVKKGDGIDEVSDGGHPILGDEHGKSNGASEEHSELRKEDMLEAWSTVQVTQKRKKGNSRRAEIASESQKIFGSVSATVSIACSFYSR